MFKAYSFVFFALFAIAGTAFLLESSNTNTGNTYSLSTVYVDRADTMQAKQSKAAKSPGACLRTNILC